MVIKVVQGSRCASCANTNAEGEGEARSRCLEMEEPDDLIDGRQFRGSIDFAGLNEAWVKAW